MLFPNTKDAIILIYFSYYILKSAARKIGNIVIDDTKITNTRILLKYFVPCIILQKIPTITLSKQNAKTIEIFKPIIFRWNTFQSLTSNFGNKIIIICTSHHFQYSISINIIERLEGINFEGMHI